jgi:hypothetical protein
LKRDFSDTYTPKIGSNLHFLVETCVVYREERQMRVLKDSASAAVKTSEPKLENSTERIYYSTLSYLGGVSI